MIAIGDIGILSPDPVRFELRYIGWIINTKASYGVITFKI